MEQHKEITIYPRLFFAPRSNETSRENFLATIDSGYPIEDIWPFLSEDERLIFKNKKKLYIWGNQKAKKPSWEKLRFGDYVAFYAKGAFVYVGKCISKKQSQELARYLWGNVPKKESSWEYLFFLDEIRPIAIPLSEIINLSQYKEKMIVQGFMPINDLGMNNIINKYGSIISFFDSYSSGISIKDFNFLENLSEKLSGDSDDLAQLDKLSLDKDINIILKDYEQKLSNEKPEVVNTKINRIKRNHIIVKKMKKKHKNKCQICGFTFQKKDGNYYSEVAHIKPLNSLEIGIDKPSNLIVLCPNHHKMLDFGSIKILSNSTFKIDNKIKNFLEPLFN